jgi:hypothetical protein
MSTIILRGGVEVENPLNELTVHEVVPEHMLIVTST